ncbi:MAG: DUF2062 domain-containing protein [Hyphomicrobium sp.]|nr:MAG: DUF2062 domain-containing protein [Hyphomicrobium sp.]
MVLTPRRQFEGRLAMVLAPPRWRWAQSLRTAGRRLVNLRASPHEIALGCALGAFVSITPLLGVQTFLAVVLALMLRASVPAAVIGTFVGNPLSWPFIWVSTYVMGLQIVGLEGAFDPSAVQRNVLLLWGALLEPSPQLFDATAALLWPLLWPMLAGSVPIGLLTAAIVYYISRNVVRGWRLRIMNRTTAAAE